MPRPFEEQTLPTAPPAALNAAIAAGLIALNLATYFIVPLFLLPMDPAWGWIAALYVIATPTLWALVHEAIHGHLFASVRWNDRLGRVLAGLYGSPFQLLRLGHLMHHRFNRSPINRIEVVESAPRPKLGERAQYYGVLLGGLYLGEVLAAFLSVLPERFYRPLIRLGFGREAPDGRSMWRAAQRQLLEEPGRSRMRLDGALIGAMLIVSFALYGAYWWILAVAILGRALVASFLDNAYHYGNPLDDVTAGDDLALPRWGAFLFLNFNYHAVHHHRPSLPWTALPSAFDAFGHRFAGGLGRAALRQLAGPIPQKDFEARAREDRVREDRAQDEGAQDGGVRDGGAQDGRPPGAARRARDVPGLDDAIDARLRT